MANPNMFRAVPSTIDPSAGPDEVRNAVREWLDAHVPGEWLSAARAGEIRRLREVRTPQAYREWYPVFAQAGLVAPSWPVEYGGLGLRADLARIVEQETAAAGLVRLNVLGLGLAGPSILHWGTDEQKSYYLPRIVTNEHRWCQLFSEPGAGSDLAGLATRAVRDGENWVVTGQKVWSSFAHESTHGMLLARTDPDVPKHRGISYFLLDLGSPGVDVRPLVQITGDTEFNEVFLDRVVVPDRHRLGQVDQGWSVAVTTLMNERSTISGQGSGFGERFGGRSIERILQLAQQRPQHDCGASIDDPATLDRIMRCWIESRLVVWTNQRARAMRQAGHEAGPEGSIGKLFQSEHNMRLQELAMDLLGADGTAWDDDDQDAASTSYGFLRSRSETIAGGTSEIQRNILGERVLGLPREPSADRELAWKDIPHSR